MNDNKNDYNVNEINDNHFKTSNYFKWGLTAFLVIISCILFVFLIYNGQMFGDYISRFFSMFMPIIDGLAVAYLLSPLVDKQEQKIYYPLLRKKNIEITNKVKGIIRIISILLSMLFVIVLIILFFKSVIPQLIDSIQDIIANMPVYGDTLINTANKILIDINIFEEKDIMVIIQNYYEDIMEFVYENILPSVNDWVKSLSNSVFSFLGAVWDLFIGFFVAVYLLLGKERLKGQTKKLIYSFFKRERANLLISDIRYINKTFLAFIVGKIVDSIIIGLLCFIVLTIFNFPYTILISVIVGVTNIIPFFGPFLGAIPSIILIFLINPLQALYFAIIILVLQQFDGNILGPMILGNSTGLSGFWVIFSITVFGGLWGVPGMFLGVPTFACIYAWFRRKMRTSLKHKAYTNNTDMYINLNYIDKDDNYIALEKTDDENDNKKCNKMIDKTKKFFVKKNNKK